MNSVLFLTPETYFTEAVQEACKVRKVKMQPLVELYLVQLLQHYVDSRNLSLSNQNENAPKTNETFAEIYLQAMSSDAVKKRELMKVVGDRSLYLTGFFADSFNKKIVDVDYYIEIGSSAYGQLHSLTKEDSLAFVFKTFSQRFSDFVEVLNHISEKSQVQANPNILSLYDRYLRTGSEIAREKLQELGVVTLPKDQLKQNKA